MNYGSHNHRHYATLSPAHTRKGYYETSPSDPLSSRERGNQSDSQHVVAPNLVATDEVEGIRY